MRETGSATKGALPARWEGRGIVVDTTHWPVLFEVMPEVFPNEDTALDAWMAHVDAVMRERATPFVMLVDALQVKKAANAHARKRMADWLSESAPYQRYCRRTVFVVGSPIVRGALTAIDWITRPRPPRSVVGTMEDALAKCRTELAAAGQPWPEAIERALG